MSQTALCVHGHFYQPPREDPLTGEIPVEPGATPYHNWNERILAECYAPNALAGNMARISFNIGPTLFNWLEMADPRTAARIVAQDRQNLRRNGVGNAMAQTYHHTIMPLATLQDKITQTRWGIADFKQRFGHAPEGMWLPETAADTETLSVLAEHGIRYTILAPWQAVDQHIDTNYPYLVELPGGRSIVVFFYNQALSTRVSFDSDSTVDAGAFMRNLVVPQFKHCNESSAEPELVMIATDGELYGHHQHFREKFLAYLLDGAVKGTEIEITYPGLWLKKYPVFRTASIVQNSSWSCHHGVTRWMGPCDCTPNGEWKAYLRQAFERIANAIDEVYFREVAPIVSDPWELRHRYIYAIQGQTSVEDLASTMAGRHIEGDDLRKIRILLCAQNERQRMFTSCGWFFDDFDRIEPRNAVAYAAQAVFLLNRAVGVDLSPKALSWLHPVKSWRSDLSADKIFSKHLIYAQEHPTALLKCRD